MTDFRKELRITIFPDEYSHRHFEIYANETHREVVHQLEEEDLDYWETEGTVNCGNLNLTGLDAIDAITVSDFFEMADVFETVDDLDLLGNVLYEKLPDHATFDDVYELTMQVKAGMYGQDTTGDEPVVFLVGGEA